MPRRQEWEHEEEDDRRYDPDEVRQRIAERLARIGGEMNEKWRICPDPACRRHHACTGPDIPCADLPPGRPPTAEEIADAKAVLARAGLPVE
ncbi:MAG TPA: hypothetical protein VHA70_02310 [Bauldia sp.]|nr:hypothetical protein [Bauldia sp.]